MRPRRDSRAYGFGGQLGIGRQVGVGALPGGRNAPPSIGDRGQISRHCVGPAHLPRHTLVNLLRGAEVIERKEARAIEYGIRDVGIDSCFD